MAYIGNTLRTAQPNYQIIDDISASFNGSTTTFALQVGGVTPAPFPVSAQHCLISVGGVIQQPDPTGTDGFLLSGSNIVFSAAPSAGEDFFGVVLAGADYINVGAAFPDGSVATPSITFDQDTDTGLYRKGANNIAITTNGTERVSIDSSGRLLVGTTTPVNGSVLGNAETRTAQFYTTVDSGNQGLGVYNVSATPFAARLELGTGKPSLAALGTNNYLGLISFVGSDGSKFLSGAMISAQTDGTVSANDLPTRLVFSTTADGASSPTERMRISWNGVINAYSDQNFNFRTAQSTAGSVAFNILTGASSTTTGSVSMRVRGDGDLENTNNSYGPISSDERLKQDIVDANSQWSDIKNVRITNFHYKNDPAGTLHLGPIAQELETVSPGLITRRPASEEEIADTTNNLVEGDEVLSFKASILYMKAVKALQEAMERIETLEAEKTAQQTQLDDLIARVTALETN